MADASGGFVLYTRDQLEATSKRIYNEVISMRILLADGQAKVRFALRVLLDRQPGLEIVGEAADAEELMAQAASRYPDLVLLGWELPSSPGTDLLPNLRSVCPELSVIALSGRPEARRVALDAGAKAFVSKSDPPERLLAAIRNCLPQPEDWPGT
jgi:two-component system nitrate/nitrite response regulator NarL